MRALVLLAAVGCVLAGGGLRAVAAPPSGGQLGIALVAESSGSGTDPRAKSYIVDEVSSGSVIVRQVRVSNGTKNALRVSLYSAAATISGGQFLFGDGHAANDLTSWIAVSPSTAVLAPHSVTDVTVRLAVPAGVGSGKRYAVIWAEAAASGAGVREISRVGIRAYVEVAGSATVTDFRIDGVTGGVDGSGVPVLTARVTNTGQRALDLTGSASLTDGPGKQSAGPFRSSRAVTIAPSASNAVTITLDPAISAGNWLAEVTLGSGETTHTASVRVSFERVIAPAVLAATPRPSEFDLRWLLLLILVGPLVVLVGWLRAVDRPGVSPAVPTAGTRRRCPGRRSA